MDKKNFIPFALPDIDEDDIKEVVDTLRSDWITTGPKTALFEDIFSEYIGSKHALAVNSATSGLHLALECVGIKPRDKVITTPYTFAATAEVIRYFDADPVFIDINKNDYNIDPRKINEFCLRECVVRDRVLYHKKTNAPVKAVIPVHIGGCPCEMDEIGRIARRYHLKVIEDAAHALPSFFKGRKIGTISDLTVFSFYATKTITTAEGGMVVTDNPEYHKRMKVMRLHGIDRDVWGRHQDKRPGWYYEIIEAGFKYNMTDVAASLGTRQLKKADLFHEKRKWIASAYNKGLKNIKGIRLPDCGKNTHSWHLYIIELDPGRFSRDDFISKLYEKNIGASVHFIPLHIQPYYRNKYNFAPMDFPAAYECYEKVVSLPIYTKLTEENVRRIIDTIKELLS